MSQTLSKPVNSTRGITNIILWVLQVAAALMFLMAGSSKLLGNPMMVGMFQTIGIGQWFRYLTGGLEVVGAILLLIPALAGLGGALLVLVMIGAVATHLFIIGGSPAIPIVLLVVTALIAWGRRERTLKLVSF
jgi:uncharacterized membrane protein YphA (DoxX/SURF4 family)